MKWITNRVAALVLPILLLATTVAFAQPAAPTLLTPLNAGVNISNTVDLRWTASAGALRYNVEVFTDAEMTNKVLDSNVGAPHYTAFMAPTPGATYWWHVNATNAAGEGAYSKPFRFTTEQTGPPPPPPPPPGVATPVVIDQWGALGSRLAATGWTLGNDDATPAGDALLSGDPGSSNWTAIRGGFGGSVTATTESAVVLTGKMEIVGGSVEEWNPFRWGLYQHSDIGELNYQNTDSAAWGYFENAGTDSATFVSNESMAYGYLVTNQTGSQDPVGGNGGSGSAWSVNGGSWISTYSGGTTTLGSPYQQAPRRAVMPAGMYDFAMSVQPLGDGTNEVRWYIFSEDQTSYWHAGTHIDAAGQNLSFDGFAFSYRPEEAETVTAINLSDVTVDLGDPITIPDAPFSSFYVDEWGAIGSRLSATGWTLDNDSTTLVGDAYISGDPGSSNWTAIRGGFGGSVEATTDEALIVTGQFEIIGSGSVEEWNPFRFGLYNHTDIGTLNYQFTDSAAWGYTENAGTDSAAFVSNEASAYGYLITNQTGSQDPVGGNGGSGSGWAVNGGSWISTYSGGTVTLGSPYTQQPRRAVMPAGTYDFAMSVQPMGDGTTEFRWYVFNEDEQSYWHAGVHTDTTAEKTEFNGFAFSYRPEEAEGITGINLYAVEVDRGAPIDIPEAPFSAFYVDQWGAIGSRLSATGWTLDNDSTTLVGDAYISGEPGSSNWTAIRGGFGGTQSATLDEALIVTGQFEIVGGSVEEWNPFRWGLYNHTDIGTLNYQFTDSAAWGYTENAGTDSAAFVSNEASAYGYLVTNQTGSQDPVGGNGGSGSGWGVNGGSWISTYSGGTITLGSPYTHQPRRAVMPAGTYDFAMSVQPMADGTTEMRWYIFNEDEQSYWHAGIHTDTTAQKTDFNGFAFSYRPEEAETVTGINLYAVQIDRGAPIEIPLAPFSSFYVDSWGFLGGKLGGVDEADSAWALTPGELVGDVSIGGEAATGWGVVAGSFGAGVTATDEAITITGNIVLDGGGFEEDGSLRFGLFNASLGSLDSTEAVGYVWSGAETANGYLFIPGSGVSGVAGGAWYDPAGDGAYALGNGTATGTPSAGTYEFEIKVGPVEGGNGVRVMLAKDDGSYTYEAVAVDGGSAASKALATTSFNSVMFGTNNSTTTALSIEALNVDMGEFSPVGIEEQPESLPKVFALDQNYPNPFNPTTNIRFSLPEAANVELTVFNMLGQKVMTLVNENLPAGFHQVSFDAKNLASGMYIYRIKAADFVSTKKMMLLE